MNFKPSFEQSQKQQSAQRTSVSPRHQKALELLTYPGTEVGSWIREQIEQNPIFELGVKKDGDDVEQLIEQLESINSQDIELPPREAQLESGSEGRVVPAERAEKTFPVDSLHEYLRLQVSMLEEEPEVIGNLKLLIRQLDDQGWLPDNIDQLRDRCHGDEEGFDRALSMLRGFDPPGVGAFGLQDCIKLQLERSEDYDPPPESILGEHFEDLQRGSIAKVARSTGLDRDEIKKWLDIIGRLNPSPGRRFDRKKTGCIRPDVFVRNQDGKWTVSLRETDRPTLGLSSHYRELLTSDEPEVLEYLDEQFSSAVWVVRAIIQRENTLYRVGRSVVNHQLDFFEKGPRYLRPLLQATVAEDIGVHESTVSRAIRDKYLQCERGIFPLEFFFDTGVKKSEGISRRAVKIYMGELVEKEDPGDPMSDRELSERVTEEFDIEIGRRLISKYREEMGILPRKIRTDFGRQ